MINLNQLIRKGDLKEIKNNITKENISIRYNETPLHIACKFGADFEVIDYFISIGADPNAKNNATPLHFCCMKKAPFNVFEKLILAGAIVNSLDNDSPLHSACKNKLDKNIIELLIKSGANANLQDGNTSLHNACAFNLSDELIKLLILSTNDVNIQNKRTPLHNVCFGKTPSLEIIKLLIEAKADVNLKDGFTPLHLICQKKSSYEIALCLIKAGAKIDEKDDNIPLHFALENQNDLKFIEVLVSNKIGINQPNGNFPLHLYCKSGSSQNIVELLIKSGADINCQNGETPLHFACLLGDSNFIHFLVSIGAKINVINKDTPLHFTCRNYKNLQSIYWLCLFGSEIHLKNNEKPVDCTYNQEVKEFFERFESVCEDIGKLFKRREFCDYEIKLKDCVIPVHKLILQTRIGETKFEKAINFLKKKRKFEIEIILKFIYSGLIKENDYQRNYEIINEFAEGIEENEEWIKKKKERKGLIEDLKKLYEDENGKDFIIISEDKEIKVHKLILQARSELFRGMFVSVNDNSNRVNDYSDKSNESLSYFIKFLYYDEIDYGMKESIYDDLEELQDFYQLNERSFLRDHIDNLKSNF